jgi:hypothetical protein
VNAIVPPPERDLLPLTHQQIRRGVVATAAGAAPRTRRHKWLVPALAFTVVLVLAVGGVAGSRLLRQSAPAPGSQPTSSTPASPSASKDQVPAAPPLLSLPLAQQQQIVSNCISHQLGKQNNYQGAVLAGVTEVTGGKQYALIVAKLRSILCAREPGSEFPDDWTSLADGNATVDPHWTTGPVNVVDQNVRYTTDGKSSGPTAAPPMGRAVVDGLVGPGVVRVTVNYYGRTAAQQTIDGAFVVAMEVPVPFEGANPAASGLSVRGYDANGKLVGGYGEGFTSPPYAIEQCYKDDQNRIVISSPVTSDPAKCLPAIRWRPGD